MATQIQSGLATGSEGLVCFVCDVGVVGRYYTLATCRTQTTKVRLIEKLGQLVGDDYMVIISEEDVICRGCATMINSLDRLEKEVGSLRSIVLRYLEKKYDMEDGELVNTRTNPPPSAAPPQSKSSAKDSGSKTDSTTSFYARKRKFMEESNEELKEIMSKEGKDCSWLQCNKCKFTTPASSTSEEPSAPVINSVVNNKKEEPKLQPTSIESIPANPVVINHEEKVNGQEPEENSRQLLQDIATLEVKKEPETIIQQPQTVSIINSQIQQLNNQAEEQFVDISTVNTEGNTGIEMVAGGKQVTLQAVEAEDGTNTICMVDENGIIVQKVEQAEDGTLYVQMADGNETTKQVLSVAEDGSVQMVEVLWDDMVTTDDSATMVTF